MNKKITKSARFGEMVLIAEALSEWASNGGEARTAALNSIAESLSAIATELREMNERQAQEYEYQTLKSS